MIVMSSTHSDRVLGNLALYTLNMTVAKTDLYGSQLFTISYLIYNHVVDSLLTRRFIGSEI